ncbi:unnamed protein product, partial [Effrenium voratum]
ECELLRQQVAEAAATTPESTMRQMEVMEAEARIWREECEELRCQVREAAATTPESSLRRIEELEASLAQSVLPGCPEPKPVKAGPGNAVFAGVLIPTM